MEIIRVQSALGTGVAKLPDGLKTKKDEHHEYVGH
jgi:hypothetical protein